MLIRKFDTFKVAVSGADRLRVIELVSTPLTWAVDIELVTKPGVVDVTVTVRVHVAPALMVPPVYVMLLSPVPVLSVPPEQAPFFVSVLVVLTPVGRLSVTLTLVIVESLGAIMLTVMMLVPPGAMLVVANTFEPVIGKVPVYTLSVAPLEGDGLQISPLPLLKQAPLVLIVLV